MKEKIRKLLVLIKNTLLYGGNDRESYVLLRDYTAGNNRSGLKWFSALGFLGLMVAYIMSFNVASLRPNGLFYISEAGVLLGIFVANLIWKKKNWVAFASMYIFMISAFIFGIYLCIVGEANSQPTSFLVLIAMVPLLFTGSPIATDGIVIGAVVIYAHLSYHIMDADSYLRNLTIVIIYGVISIFVSTYFMIIKLKRSGKGMRSQMFAVSKSQFLSNMSHEIRTPINAVLGMNEMILRESSEGAIVDYAGNIKNAGKMLLSLVNDILDYSKLESGNMNLVQGMYELADIIQDLNTMIAYRFKEKNLTFNIDVNPNLPSGYIGDDVRINQIILNLLTNAAKYTMSGSVTLKIDGVVNEGNVRLRVEVIDTGIGIKPEDIDKLKQEYVRVDEDKNKSIEGTGLGISIVQKLLELMKSDLEITSEYGKGSSFAFEIEQMVIDPMPIGDIYEHLKKAIINTKHKKSFTAPEAKLLVVDDNHMNLSVFVALLKNVIGRIDIADSGNKALDMLRHEQYDMIFMDHMMPEMDGIETFKKLREMESPNKETPVFALTANAIAGAKDMYLEAGFSGYLSKPINISRLESTIRNYLPKDLIKEGEEKITTENYHEDTPMIEGLDWNVGYMRMNDMNLLVSTVRSYPVSLLGDIEVVSELYMQIKAWNKDALDNFRVKVHSMKSSAALIGLMPLAGMAATLEYAARDGREAFVEEVTPHFIEECYRYYGLIKAAVGNESSDEKSDSWSFDEIKEILTKLKVSLEEFDVHAADDNMNELSKYKFDDNFTNEVEKLSGAVVNLDVETGLDLIDKMLELLK